MGINEKNERRELIDTVADAGRLARGLDQLLESLAHADQLDPLDAEGVQALRTVSERCAERIGDAARILEAQSKIPLRGGAGGKPNPSRGLSGLKRRSRHRRGPHRGRANRSIKPKSHATGRTER